MPKNPITNHTVNLTGTNVVYQVKTNRRSRGIRVTIYPDKRLVISAPSFGPIMQRKVDDFLLTKADWILKKLNDMQNLTALPNSRQSYQANKIAARQLALERLQHFNQHYRLPYVRVAIKNQSSRWGSCSKKGNLNFNFKIIFLPSALVNYVIVHELCHLAQFNHSAKFWQLVSQTIPNHKILRRQLHQYSL